MDAKELMVRIVRCPRLRDYWIGKSNGSECAGVAGFQRQQGIRIFDESQVPEAWCGDIENAPILFVSSVCGFAPDEHYPLQSWSDDRVCDFFTRRFEENIQDGLYYRRTNGQFSEKWTRYWGAVRSRSRELLGREPVPGVDYALTEIVHCKSNAEDGVREARETCSQAFLRDVLTLSGARVIVCMGQHVRETFMERFADVIPAEAASAGYADRVRLCGRDRALLFLPHANARKARTIASLFPEVLPRLRELLVV